MPALILFGRRWRIGSDDFVFPGCFEALVRTSWLLLTVILFLEHINDSHNEDGTSCPKGKFLIEIYLYGVMAILTITLVASILLVIHSARGEIMDTCQRKHVGKILTFRVIMGMIEIGWNILGTVWLYSSLVQCERHSPLWILLEALVIFTWVALPILIITALLLFEPMMRPEGQESKRANFSRRSFIDRTNSGIGSHYIQLWERRCRFLCCTFSKDDNSTEAFRNVADVLASVFEKSDVVASDIAAALVLLRVKRKFEEEEKKQKHKENISRSPPIYRVSADSNVRNMTAINETSPEDWMTVGLAHHYMKFALGSYGWPFYVYGRVLSAAFQLRHYVQCCACCRNLNHESEDNCCMCNLAALRAVTGLPFENIIRVSFHNKIYECPYFVAIDDKTQKVVISIRGTLSLHDAITDLNAQNSVLEGLPDNWRAHKGILNAAENLRKTLQNSDVLKEAFEKAPHYGLVITGHSLGAGAAVLLAAMMRPQYPDLRCFAYSPPGGLCSMQMAKATESFVMSVIVGDDLVPRLSLNAIHDLHNKILDVLHSCKKPKYRVLAKGCWYMCCGISRKSLMSSIDEGSSQDHLIGATRISESYSAIDEESLQDVRIIFSEPPLRPIPRHTETLLFPPGRIMYLKPDLENVDNWNYEWADTTDFDKIIISPNMLRHHLPQMVLKVLETVDNK